ncbi:MAG: SDR family NAD(P)-dependent oxidoreductase [Actinomycetota bacterium]|nr:SDR family NAD(P)-dependent oxidoreductase [Actinomycetota bacterium]
MEQTLPPGIVVVTGASRGIGQALVRQLLASGREVVGLARHTDTANGADDPPSPTYARISADLSSVSGIAEGIEEIRRAVGERPVAALVNSAGAVTPLGALTERAANPCSPPSA